MSQTVACRFLGHFGCPVSPRPHSVRHFISLLGLSGCCMLHVLEGEPCLHLPHSISNLLPPPAPKQPRCCFTPPAIADTRPEQYSPSTKLNWQRFVALWAKLECQHGCRTTGRAAALCYPQHHTLSSAQRPCRMGCDQSFPREQSQLK